MKPTESSTDTLVKRAEFQEVMNSLNPKKSPCYDLITGKILKELPIIGIKYLTQLFCGLVVRVSGYRSRGQVSIPGATRFSE
jgi:hypothetical protein